MTHAHKWHLRAFKDRKDNEDDPTLRWECQPCPDANNRGRVSFLDTTTERPGPLEVPR